MIKKLECILFHNIITINPSLFYDSIAGKKVGWFRCIDCKIEFLANKKRSWFRVIKNKKL